MKQDKWTQQLHDKLAEHEVPAPEGLWADIEAALPQPESSGLQTRRARIIALRRWAAAAVVAALLAGGGLALYNNNVELSDSDSRLAVVQEDKPMLEEQNEQTAEEERLPAKQEKLQQLTAMAEKPRRGEETTGRSETPAGDPAMAEKPRRGEETTGRDETPAVDPAIVSPERATDQTTPSHRQSHPVVPYTAQKARSEAHPHPTLSLYAMNGFGSQDNSNAVLMADAMAQNYANTSKAGTTASARRQSPIYLTGYEEHQHHHQPIAFGLSVDYPLTRQLSLTSGIVYTKLQSEFTQTMRSQVISKDQRLHYLGVPLSLNYKLWQYKGIRAYVSAGMQADWNIKARMEAEGVEQKMSRDRMQLSANGSIGIQYNLLPQLSLYAEPGINHYFDNGSNVQNFFKDKPTSLKLQFGIRLNIQPK